MSQEHSQKLIDELTTAYRTEVKGYFYYNAAADIVTNDKGRNVLRHLATDELDHIRAVSAIGESLRSGEGLISYEDAAKAGAGAEAKAADLFPGENELVERLKADPSDKNAVQIGVEIEEAAVDFYSSLLADAASPEEKVLLTELLEMEKGHLKILRWELEALTQSGFWGDTMEFSVEKETE